jgi:hypothetical protein
MWTEQPQHLLKRLENVTSHDMTACHQDKNQTSDPQITKAIRFRLIPSNRSYLSVIDTLNPKCETFNCSRNQLLI